jgi:hypothetical protein
MAGSSTNSVLFANRSSSVPVAPLTPAKNSHPGNTLTPPAAIASSTISGSSPAAATRAPLSRACTAASSRSVTGVSVSGSSRASSSGAAERCVSGSNFRIDSISSPKNSNRTGRSASGEYTSRIPPRRVNCPGISTMSMRV